MRGKKDGEKFEKNYINNGYSGRIEINKTDSNGHNTFASDSYLNDKYSMIKEYKDGTKVDTAKDEQKKGIGHGKLMYVTITGIKNV